MPLLALLSILLGVAPATEPSPVPTRVSATPSPAPLSPDELFSRRALRRARLLIQMRLMQLHDEQLECVREALLRRLPATLWQEEPSPARGISGISAAASKCAEALKF
jgi:hypothetical protein